MSRPPRVGDDFAEVVVVRHGETAGNAARIIQGQLDPELNETGKQQAATVARRLSKEAKPAAVYSSDLRRAAETARTIAAACDAETNLVLEPALRERHMGVLHGLKFDEAARMEPEAFKAFLSEDRSQTIPGGGESLEQLSQRCVSYINAIADKHKGERVIVVSHGAAIEEICSHAHSTESMRQRIPNTSISVIRVGVNGRCWIADKLGDVSHVKQDEDKEGV